MSVGCFEKKIAGRWLFGCGRCAQERGKSYLQVLHPVLTLGFFARTLFTFSGYIFTRFGACDSGDRDDLEGPDDNPTVLLPVASSFLRDGPSLLLLLLELRSISMRRCLHKDEEL